MHRLILLLTLMIVVHIPIRAQSSDGYRTAQARIAAAASSGATELSLRELGLTTIPPEIGELTHICVFSTLKEIR